MDVENTSITLMGRIMRGPTEEDWERFFKLYSPGILSYAQSLGLSADQAKDCLQEVMIVLLRRMGKDFQYDPRVGRFRGYLKQIIRYKVLRMREREYKRNEHPIEQSDEGPNLMAVLPSEAVADDDQTHWQRLLMVTALSKVEAEYNEQGSRSFLIFRENVLRERAPAEVAREFGETANNVYQIKNRIFARLRTIIQFLEENGIASVEELPSLETI